MCCRHRGRSTFGMWNTRTWFSAFGACFNTLWLGVFSDTFIGAANHKEVVAGGGWVTFWVVMSYTLHTKEVCLLGLAFATMDCCEVVTDELQAELIYEHVEGGKPVAGMRMGSVGIHDDVGPMRNFMKSLCSQR